MFFERDMVTTTTDMTSPEFVRDQMIKIIDATNEGAKIGAKQGWDLVLMPILSQYWRVIAIGFFVALIVFTIKAFMGRWGSLGSLLYNTMYFGIILITGLIFGAEFLVSDFWHIACEIALYPFCYYVTGKILNWMGVRRSHL